MFSLVFISVDSQSQDVPAGTPFRVIGPMRLRADCRDLMRRRAEMSDVEVLRTDDDSGPTVWRTKIIHKNCLIDTQVHLVLIFDK